MPQDLMGDSAMQEQPGLPQQPKMQLPMSGSPVPSLAGMGGGLPNMGATGAKLPNFQPTAGAGAGQYMPGFGMRKPMAMAGAAPGAGAGGRPLASAMGLAVTGDMPMSGMQQDIGAPAMMGSEATGDIALSGPKAGGQERQVVPVGAQGSAMQAGSGSMSPLEQQLIQRQMNGDREMRG